MSAVETRAVTAEEAPLRLDRWFRRHFPWLTQGAVEKLCRTGQVRVDGGRVAASARLEAGQMVRIPPLPAARPMPARERFAVDETMRRELEAMVIHCDGAVLALNKPAGLAVQGGPGITRHLDGMLDALRFDAASRPLLVHRLDRDTSGVLLLGRSAQAAAALASSFRERRVEKTYWAVVAGIPQPEVGTIRLALTRRDGGRQRMEADPEGERAITAYRVLDRAGKRFAWLELRPETGRTHQLRVHAASLGTPILGDAMYGPEEHPTGFARRLHLHARALDLPHPEGGRLALEAALPPHFNETFTILGFG